MLKFIPARSLFVYSWFIITFIFTNVQSIADSDANVPVKMSLVTAATAVNAQDTILIGLELVIDDGWKIYAPYPNHNSNDDDSARHPQLAWNKQTNVASMTIKWPDADHVYENKIPVPVYYQHVLIPIVVKLIDPTQPVHLDGIVSLISCSDQCLPIEQKISLDISSGQGIPTQHAAALNQLLYQTSKIQDPDEPSLLWMLVVAFVGGVILNFMPCVLPVLSLKLKFLVNRQSTSYRLNFLATFLGIMASFILFALIAIGLQQSGHVFGWGSHFQEPYFIVFMCVIMTVFIGNILGYVDLTLPHAFRSLLNHFAGFKFDQSQVAVEGFISGIIATLLATPCTAPFLGTAVGYALSKGPVEIMILFAALGCGFSLPYLAGLIIPLQYIPLPKPGRWMTILSRILAVGLMGTVIWLLWVLTQTKGSMVTSIVSICLCCIIAILFFLKSGNRWRHLAWLGALTAFLSTYYLSDRTYPLSDVTSIEYWQPFNEQVIDQALADNKIVFVDVTAAWCTTCHLNKAVVLNRHDFKAYLSSSRVVAMRADWTARDPAIGHFLAKYHRHGIPFNIVYGPQAPYGIVLPEILSWRDITQAFDKAGYKQ